MAGLKQEVAGKLNLDLPVEAWAKEEGIADEEMAERLLKAADEAYAERVERNTPEAMRYVEKQVILQSLDHLWREHLVTLDHLRQVIGWRGMGQRDPLNEYKSEAFDLFRTLIAQWHEAVIAQMMRIEVRFQAPEPPPPPMQFQHPDPRAGENEAPFGQIAEPVDGGPFSAVAVAATAAPALGRVAERDPRQSRELGQDRPQRAVPVRLGQEVQALPRPVRLTPPGALHARTTRAEALKTLTRAMRGVVDEPAREARLLLAAAGALETNELIGAPEAPLGAAAPRLDAFAARRAAGEPLSRILGRREFWSLSLAISPDVLDPRPETETIVEAALAKFAARRGEPLRRPRSWRRLGRAAVRHFARISRSARARRRHLANAQGGSRASMSRRSAWRIAPKSGSAIGARGSTARST